MLNLYIAKVLDDAFLFLPKLTLDFQQRVKKNKNKQKQQQMITGELLLNYALKDSGYEKEIITEYLPKLVLKGNELSISKSHSYNYVLVAISTDNVGCDIQKITSVKNPNKLLAKEELKHYLNVSEEDKQSVFTMYWTAKEAYIKYFGFLTKEYKQIYFQIEKTFENYNVGKIDELFCYQSFFNDYSFSAVTKKFIASNVIFVNSENLTID